MSSDDRQILLHEMASLNFQLPSPRLSVTADEAKKIGEAILKNCAFTEAGELLVERAGLSTILQTDAAGIRKFAAMNGKYAVRLEQKVFFQTDNVQKELSTRIQEPRDIEERENLKQSEAFLIAARDHPELEKRRALEESRNLKRLPGVKRQVRRESSHCLSGEPLEKSAPIHHIERVEDEPRRILDRSNLVALNQRHHHDVHRNDALGASALNALAEERGWDGRVPEGN